MKIDNAVYRNVAVRWDAVTLPLKAGTPMSAAGVPSNDGGAVGIVTQTVAVRPPVDGLPVLVGGDVSRQEAEALYGEAISDDALAAMSGIRFFGEHGTPDHAPDGGGGSTGGGVMYVSEMFDEVTEVGTLDKTAREIINCVNGQGIVAIVTSDTWPINTDNPGDQCYVSYLGSAGFVDNVWCISTESGSNYYAATLDDCPTDQQPGG